MATVNETLVTDIVREVLRRLGTTGADTPGPASPLPRGSQPPGGQAFGVFNCVDAAVAAATKAQQQLVAASMEVRAAAVEAVRLIMRRDKEELGRIEFEETKIGKLAHKLEKLELCAGVPGIEFLRTEATSGDHGLTVTEYAPWGVVGVVTPVTHSIPTLGCNAIMILSAGNALVCNPHPGGARCAVEATRRWNREIYQRTGIDNLICIIERPTLESAEKIFQHPGIALLLVTGGPGVAKAAMNSGKRAIAAGPGNPPVVVDETADIERAAAGIIAGASYDNNLLCIGEKEVFVVASVAEKLLSAMSRHGGYRLTPAQMRELAPKVVMKDDASGHWHARKEFIGQDPQVIAEQIGVRLPAGVVLLYGETDLNSPLLPCEQMMPLLPIVPVASVDEGIRQAVHFEHGFRHTAIMWSRNIDNLTKLGKACGCTLYVKNGPSFAGLGVGGQGYSSFSIATPTGEGITNPLSFTRYRRCAMVDALRIF